MQSAHFSLHSPDCVEELWDRTFLITQFNPQVSGMASCLYEWLWTTNGAEVSPLFIPLSESVNRSWCAYTLHSIPSIHKSCYCLEMTLSFCFLRTSTHFKAFHGWLNLRSNLCHDFLKQIIEGNADLFCFSRMKWIKSYFINPSSSY